MKHVLWMAAALATLCVSGLTLAQVHTINPSDGKPAWDQEPGGKTATSKPTSKPAEELKYDVPTDQQIEQSKRMMDNLYARAKKEVNPKLHKVETEHFIIFSGLSPDMDKGVGATMERMYDHLYQNFVHPDKPLVKSAGKSTGKSTGKNSDKADDQHVWVGKCGIFLLTLNPPDQFAKFAMDVDGLDKKIADGAAGYFRSTAIQSYVVMKPPPTGRAWEMDYWQSTMIHESTHAFLFRYISNKTVPTWLNEGIAETSAANITNSKYLAKRLREANSAAFKGKDVMPVFKSVDLKEFDYGIAQSWVRFLILKDSKTFLQFLALCKQGVDDEEAMQKTYQWSRQEFLKAWAKWAMTVK